MCTFYLFIYLLFIYLLKSCATADRRLMHISCPFHNILRSSTKIKFNMTSLPQKCVISLFYLLAVTFLHFFSDSLSFSSQQQQINTADSWRKGKFSITVCTKTSWLHHREEKKIGRAKEKERQQRGPRANKLVKWKGSVFTPAISAS